MPVSNALPPGLGVIFATIIMDDQSGRMGVKKEEWRHKI